MQNTVLSFSTRNNTFNNATVTSPIPNGGSGQYTMLVLSVGSFAGGVDNALFMAGSITNPSKRFIRSKMAWFNAANWTQIAGGDAMANALSMSNQLIINVLDPTLAQSAAT